MGVSNFKCKLEERAWSHVEGEHNFFCYGRNEGLVLVLFKNIISHVAT